MLEVITGRRSGLSKFWVCFWVCKKENGALSPVFPRYLAEWTGLEPATPGVTGRYSNQLNYHSW